MERAGSPGSYDESLVLLTGRETTEEFMSLALALEEGSRMFYKKVGGLTSAAEAKNIFNTLAKVEARHKRNILQANRLINGATLTNDVLIREPLQGVMEGGIRIEDAIRFIKQQGNSLLDILEVSMQVETNALDLYIKIFRTIENENAKKVFGILIGEEKQHLSRLGELLGSRVA